MRAKNCIASLILALLSALNVIAGATGNVQNQRQIVTVHSLQTAPVKSVCAHIERAQSEHSKAQTKVVLAEMHAPSMQYGPGSGSCIITDSSSRSIKPCAVAAIGNDLYFLSPEELWRAKDAVSLLKQKRNNTILTCTKLCPSTHKVNGFLMQEFCDFVAYPLHKSLIVLEKSGDLLEFNPVNDTWHMVWPNKPITYSPDPDFISLTSLPNAIVLLDPERNELWKFDGSNLSRLIIPEVLPWKAKWPKPSLADGLEVCADHQNILVLKKFGTVTEYSGKRNVRAVRQFNCKSLGWLRPTRICNGQSNLLIVDREHNALVELNKRNGGIKVQFFPLDSDLRSICAVPDGFYMINGDNLAFLPPFLPAAAKQSKGEYVSRSLDPRFQKLRLPIYHSHLPSHPGVWPGARRLYRYGVHKGVDFFYDTGCGIPIKIGTPVCAAADGKIVRIDNSFKDLSGEQYARVMKECVRNRNTSQSNEDLLRGCQVWIDHGDGLLTKYAHLEHTNHKLHAGDFVKRGKEIGYVGVSGTGENLPGRVKQPHLHFEVWLDGHYLGYGLTPAETIAVYERIFGCGC